MGIGLLLFHIFCGAVFLAVCIYCVALFVRARTEKEKRIKAEKKLKHKDAKTYSGYEEKFFTHR